MTRATLRQTWETLRTSYWFAPVLAALLAFFLARLILGLDLRLPGTSLKTSPFIYAATPEDARTIMITLAATVLGTAGIVFSLLTVPLSLVASQFGSRLLRIYVRDGPIQFVLAVFVGTFVYCLSLALAIPIDGSIAMLYLTTTVGLALSLVSFGCLLVLIHHIASALQAPNLVATASQELANVIAATARQTESRLPAGLPVGDNALSAHLEQEGVAIYATRQGYIQDIDTDLALTLATRHDLVIRLVCKPGIFVEDGQLIAIVAPAARVSSRVAANIAGSYRLGNARTPTQDVEYAVNQLVEVAVRAMSPAINDPFTAMTCLDHLGARLAVLAARPPTKAYVYDSNGRPRLLLDSISFAELLNTAFHMLRRAARDNTEVLFSLLQAIEVIGRPLCSDDYRAQLLRHIQLVEAESQASSSVAWDKERVGRRCAELAQKLNGVEGNTNVARG